MPAGEPDPRLDPELLADGDTRNVVDRYRGWRQEAIVADLDARRHPFHVAVENWQHDLNIGSVVRNANAFLAAEMPMAARERSVMMTDPKWRTLAVATTTRLVSAPTKYWNE